ncbi:Nif3-like dinuclear metal center hexameric protein [Ornithinimicrobium cavernae]|uniref:Nif3-like dinuclear metal center hexameric protein n=1 Tax=Ornithinimicrobium cavernae TaxID=2666047 RepID=UPI001379F04D|nr:Nif3-like dinuclear metal center hexameric protein [Ornithinimicrobium cavernae]
MTETTDDLSLRDVVAALERLYPLDTAQSWDRVGLVSGDLDQPVRRIHLAVDPTLAVIEEAKQAGADLVITHHPLLLRGIHSVATTTAKGAAVTELIVNDIALYCAHTNADVADPGVGQALAEACGLSGTQALEITEGQELGRVGDLPEPLGLAEFARRLHEALPRTAGGVRVSGPADGTVRRVAVLGGAGDSSFEAVRASGADVYVTADLRHHPALEAREEASLTGGTPYLVDAGHFASESLWLPGLASRLVTELGPAAARLEVHVSQVRTDPWDFVLGAAAPEHTQGDHA